ncbi:MAG: hypothetical protein M1840_008442 [Geoglossum simile]|nr:MAG: hypothetical protein M1840_008442 [Geoglossum simile]
MLSNYEVLSHLESMRSRYNNPTAPTSIKMKSGNLETVMKEAHLPTKIQNPTPPFPKPTNRHHTHRKPTNATQLLDYLHTPPSPLLATHRYTAQTIQGLIAALRPYKLEKPELLMILNLRPATTAELDVVVEEMDQRFAEPEVEAILRVVAEVLGGGEEGA